MKKLVYSLMLVALLVFAGCEKVDTPAVPILSIVDGNNQTAVAHTTLPLPLRVCVSMQTENGRCFCPQQTVTFSVEEGGGHVSSDTVAYTGDLLAQVSATVLTGSDGMAQVTWTLGNAGVQAVTAEVVDPSTGKVLSSVTFRSIAMPASPSGDGLFSVSAGHQVRFAPGNLDYNGGYFFTAHQYDYGGYFGWGTGSNPTDTSADDHDYPTFDDWGNHIAGGWRTLTASEWNYVIYYRPNAAAKRGAATVCGVYGMVLLPDNFSGGTFTSGTYYYERGWSRNVYDASSWSEMEDAGAVFFPAAGSRGYDPQWADVGVGGDYWSSTPDSELAWAALLMGFSEYGVSECGFDHRCHGYSVRLVQDY